MPATSVRDLVIKDDDIVVGTHGRSFWILDDITSLRQIARSEVTGSQFLYKPQAALRIRWSMYTDTPLPQEEPAGENPPDGAVIDYYLRDKAYGPVTLDIFDANGNTVCRFSSDDKPYKIPELNIPLYWIRPQQLLSAEAGSHRFCWDLHYTPIDAPPSYPISAIYMNTVPSPNAPWAMPGRYTVKLTAGDKVLTEHLVVKMDPRVKTPLADLLQQHDWSMRCYKARLDIQHLVDESNKTGAPSKDRLSALKRLDGTFGSLLNTLHEADIAPTVQAMEAVTAAKKNCQQLKGK